MKASKTLILTSLLGMAAAPLSAQAGTSYHRAEVIDVVPIMQVVRVSAPQQECWKEQVVHRDRGHDSRAGLVVGGIAGGIIGNRFGGGNGRKVATVAGTIAGAALGDHLSRGPERSYTTSERHCRTIDRWYDEERTVGYRVHYRFRGDNYWTEMDRHPGKTIRVRVDVTPVD